MDIEEYKEGEYSFCDKEFLLSPEAEILRSLANSLYPSYLSRLHREGKPLTPHPVPVLDIDFVASTEALWFRVLSETIHTEIVLKQQEVLHTILFFGSAKIKTKSFAPMIKMPDYYQLAQDLAEKFTRWSLDIRKKEEEPQKVMVCTGGGPGIMEAGNRGARKAGGRSLGLNIRLPTEQISNPYIPESLTFSFRYFFTRKFHFLRRAKAAVVFPGGFGTMDELFETLTLIQTGKMDPIKIILFDAKYWKDVINIEKMVQYSTILEHDMRLFEYHDSVNSAFNSLVKELQQFLE